MKLRQQPNPARPPPLDAAAPPSVGAEPRAVRRRVFRLLPLLAPLLVLLVTGLRGLDFGHHWDERHYQIGPVETMVRTGRWLPGYYGYPSFNYWVSTAALTPEAISATMRGTGVRAHLLATAETHAFLLRLRAVFLALSALAVVWVYLLVLSWRNSVAEAALAASFLALSWEVAYHIRWIATDGVLMQFGALTMLLVVRSQVRPGGGSWLYPAAFTAGLAAGTKYPGALLLLPVLLAGGALWVRQVGLRGAALRMAAACALAGAAVLLSTPALVLDTSAVIEGIRYEISHYAGGHAGHSVRRGPQHLLRMADYLGIGLFSWYAPIGAAVGALAGLGVWALKREPWLAIVFLCFPVLYLLYFSMQKAMVVRNLLVVAPFLAILAARGAAWSVGRLREAAEARGPRWRLWTAARQALIAVLAVALVVNAGWLWTAASSILQRHSTRFVREALAHVQGRPETTFLLSPRVTAHFAVLGVDRPPNSTLDATAADQVLFYAHEAMRSWEDWPANRRRLADHWFGPYEVNFNIYPNWWGDDRIVVMRAARAAELGVLGLERLEP